MPVETIEIKREGFRCERCGHEWVPLDVKNPPRVCPKCKSPYWDLPKEKPEPLPAPQKT